MAHMSMIIAFILGNTTIMGIIAGAVAFLGWGWKQRRAGAAAERAKQAKAEAKARDIRDMVDNDMGALPPDQARKELGTWDR